MATKIVMLALSPTMETGTIVKWHKKEGENVGSGDLLCEVETDKATMDFESPAEGTLLKVVASEGSAVKVGETIAVTGDPGEDITGLLEQPAKEVPQSNLTPVMSAPQVVEQKKGGENLPGGVKASPLAREYARQAGVDISSISGSGPGGRIIKEDVEKAARAPKAPPVTPSVKGEQKIAVSEKRHIIAKRLSESKFSAPHFYLSMVVTMDGVLASRIALNKKSDSRVSLNAFLIKFTAEALRRHPVVNSTWGEDFIIQHGSIDIGLAVAQSDGLITPVVRNCEAKGIVAIDIELRDLVERARNGKLSPQEYTGATFTISNLGSYGVRQFTAIINPPGSAILAVGEIFQETEIDDSGVFRGKHNKMIITLSCDHRVIDGARAAQFAADLKNLIENPITVLY